LIVLKSFLLIIHYDKNATSYNKAYALHSLAVVRATPNRGGEAAATSHKQDVIRNSHKINDPASMPGISGNKFNVLGGICGIIRS